MCTTSKVQEIIERGYKALNALESNEAWVVSLLKDGLQSRHSEVADLCFQGLLLVNRLLGPGRWPSQLGEPQP